MAIISTFNPSAMSSELIEGTFVQREALAQRLVEVFEDSARHDSKHNVLLVGPRGIGKSHLVSLVYHRLKAKTDLSDKLLIAYLREDEWGITSFLDLLARTLYAALDEVGQDAPASLRDLSKLGRKQAEDHVWRSLQQLLGSRTLLVITENLDATFEKIGEEGQQQWRALMQTHPQWAVLATTQALFSGISRQVSPFYGFFEVIHLQPLSLEDAIALLRRLASCNKDEKTAEFLDSPVGRALVRAVQHIAGGNHRIFVLFYEFLNQAGSEHFVEPLLKTVDALTPYYQSQMARLSPQQQKIVNFLCEYRRPANVTTIATNCFTTNQTAASQLKQLLTERYVRVDRVGRESFYELAEPLLRICVEAKTHRDTPLHLLVDFMRYWFSREELERRLTCTGEHDPGKPYLMAALKEYDARDAHVHVSPEIASLCRALSRASDAPELARARAEELAELSKIAEDWSHYALAMLRLDRGSELIPILETKLEQEPDNTHVLRDLSKACLATGSIHRAEQVLDRAIELSPGEGYLLLDKGELLAYTNREPEALQAFDDASVLDPDLRSTVAVEKAHVLIRMKDYKAAREVLSPYLSKGKTVPGVFFYYAATLAYEDDPKGALIYLDKATTAFENDSVAWGNKGVVLCGLERYAEALEALNRSLALDSSQERFLHHRCEALIETKQYARAVETASPEHLSHNIFHQLLKVLNSRPNEGGLQQALLQLKNAQNSDAWQTAFVGGLTEFASVAADFDQQEEVGQLQTWNAALGKLFADQDKFSILVKLFDVLTRVKVFGDQKALLELPREQRMLLVKNRKEEGILADDQNADQRRNLPAR